MIKNFTKIAILCLIMGTSFTACKKDSKKSNNDSDTFSMKFTANGTAVSYNTCAVADVEANGSSYTEFVGLNGQNPNNSLQVEIVAGISTLKAGQTYPVSSDYLGANSAIVFYTPDGTNYFTTQANAPAGTVTITSVTSTTIKGTFSAKLYGSDDEDGSSLKYTIASGTFVAKMPK